MNSSSEPNHSSPAAVASSPSQPLLTMVGLGPPLELSESALAGMTAYLADEPEAASERTWVGFPPAPGIFDDDTPAELEETPSDEITLVANYDEITVVTTAPVAARAPVPPVELAAPVEPSAPLGLEAVPLAPEATPPFEVLTERDGVVELDAVELVESDPELKIFPPSLESFVPPKRFSGAPRAVALALAVFIPALGALAWVASTKHRPITLSAPEKTVAALPNDQTTTEARARAVARALEESVAEQPPAAEVVSVHDLRVKPEASRTQLASAPGTPFVAVDLDRASDESAGERGTLTITSTPPSNVVLDGRPLGRTPHELGVAAGPHSVVFIHPLKGRKSVRVEAAAGKTAVASVSF